MELPEERVSLAAACRRLGMSWAQGWRRLLRGELQGEQDERGRWHVTVESVERLRREREATPPSAA